VVMATPWALLWAALNNHHGKVSHCPATLLPAFLAVCFSGGLSGVDPLPLKKLGQADIFTIAGCLCAVLFLCCSVCGDTLAA